MEQSGKFRVGDIWVYSPVDWFEVVEVFQNTQRILLRDCDGIKSTASFHSTTGYKLDETSRVTKILNEYKS